MAKRLTQIDKAILDLNDKIDTLILAREHLLKQRPAARSQDDSSARTPVEQTAKVVKHGPQ